MLKWQVETLGKDSYEVAMLADRTPVIHYEVRGRRYRIYSIAGSKEKLIKQGIGKAKAICEAHAMKESGLADDDAIQQNAVSRTAKPHQPTDFDRARNRLRLWLGLMAAIGAAGLAFYHWVMFQPTNALMFAGVLILLAMLTRQTLRLWHGEISFSQFLGFADVGSAKGKKVSFHAKR